MTVSGRKVLITGGGTGVGANLAMSFANAGADVVVTGRRIAPLEAVAAQSRKIRAITSDVTDEASVNALFKMAGPVDIVIANAGAAQSAPFEQTSLDLWNQMIDANLTGVFLTLRAGLQQMNRWGRLISVASTAGLKGYPYVAPYVAAKHGVVGLTRALALEVAKRDITVNAIAPGFLDTEMTDRSVANLVDKTKMTKEMATNALKRNNPQNRLIAPSEVSVAALWLCGAGSEGINGQAISISGGEV